MAKASAGIASDKEKESPSAQRSVAKSDRTELPDPERAAEIHAAEVRASPDVSAAVKSSSQAGGIHTSSCAPILLRHPTQTAFPDSLFEHMHGPRLKVFFAWRYAQLVPTKPAKGPC